jgi:hypothetical protein
MGMFIMNKSVSGFAVLLAVFLVACAPARPITATMNADAGDNLRGYDNRGTPLQKFSMLELGRALSKGSVDIYDPWLPTLTIPVPDFSVSDPLATFPVHPRLYVRNKNVRVYSLDSNMALDNDISFSNVLESIEQQQIDEIPNPVPLFDDVKVIE